MTVDAYLTSLACLLLQQLLHGQIVSRCCFSALVLSQVVNYFSAVKCQLCFASALLAGSKPSVATFSVNRYSKSNL